MHTPIPKKLLIGLTLICILLPLASCSQPTAAPALPTSTETEAIATPKASAMPTATQTPLPAPSTTPTQNPVSLYIDSSPPNNMLNMDEIASLVTTNLADASLWFGQTSDAPEGEVLAASEWVYALAAPFPTLADNISLAELAAFWQGSPEGTLSNLKTLYLPAALAGTLKALWGTPSQETIQIVENLPAVETLWQEKSAWMILPFDQLNPQLKVIRIDDISPLDKSYQKDNYPLVVAFTLININQNDGETAETEPQQILNALTLTNRDPDKMTTLVMTGVTALVRATAYRMEINGVLYPAEDIVDWLSGADLTHISNEVSFYEDCPFPDPNQQAIFFCSNPDYIELFEYVGADIIELTGNHNNDSWYVYGVDVVPFSLDLYRARDMVYYGGGEDLEDALSPTFITHNGNQLAFIGCNASGPDYAWATPERGGSAPCGDYQWMAAEITRLSEAGYLPIATFQYYENYSNIPSETQISDFNLMAEAGAVIVNGSQAHRPKGMAFYEGAFIDYGLGNLFFDQMGVTINGNLIEQTRWEIIQRHTFYDGRLLSTELLTAMLEDYARPRPMTPTERLRFLTELFTASGWHYEVK